MDGLDRSAHLLEGYFGGGAQEAVVAINVFFQQADVLERGFSEPMDEDKQRLPGEWLVAGELHSRNDSSIPCRRNIESGA